jgi:gluconolactonase
MAVTALSDELYDLVDRHAAVERIATGFRFTEGPVWNHRDGYLLFSDVSGDVTVRWSEEDGAGDWRRPSGHANGLAYDGEHRLVACEHDRSAVTRTEHDGTVEVVASHFEGRELNSPNDLCVAFDGSICFTDPHPSGRTADWGIERDAELDFRGVFRVPPGGGGPILLTKELDFPNGVCLSPDERRLYVNDTWRMEIRVFDVLADGTVASNRLVLRQPGSGAFDDGIPDGMKCDERGNLYCTGPGGVWVIDPAGAHLGTIETPEAASNMCFGGPDRRTLYVTASRSVYRVPMKVRGASLPHSRGMSG